jgi:hypothetical protein
MPVLGRLVTVGAGVTVTSCALMYDSADPWAVTLILWPGSPDPVVWMFARELLAAGLQERVSPVGGCVAVAPAPDGFGGDSVQPWLQIELTNPCEGRQAVLLVPLRAVDAFLVQTGLRVAPGTEAARVDWEPVLRAWVRDGRRGGRWAA